MENDKLNEAIGDISSMAGHKVKSPTTGPKVQKSLEKLKKSITDYYDSADKMLSSQLETLKSNLDTYSNYPQLHKLDKYKELKKYVDVKTQDVATMSKLKQNLEKSLGSAIDFNLNGIVPDKFLVEPLEKVLQRPISKAADVLSDIQKSEVKDFGGVKTTTDPVRSYDYKGLYNYKPAGEPVDANKKPESPSNTTPASTTSEPPKYGEYKAPGEKVDLAQPQKPEPKVNVAAGQPSYGEYKAPGEPVTSKSSVTEPEIKPVETPSEQPVVNQEPVRQTEHPPVTQTAPSTPEEQQAGDENNTAKIQEIKQNIALQTKISQILDKYLTNLTEKDDSFELLTEATLSEFLSDENIQKLKKIAKDKEKLKLIANELKNVIKTETGFKFGRGRFSVFGKAPSETVISDFLKSTPKKAQEPTKPSASIFQHKQQPQTISRTQTSQEISPEVENVRKLAKSIDINSEDQTDPEIISLNGAINFVNKYSDINDSFWKKSEEIIKNYIETHKPTDSITQQSPEIKPKVKKEPVVNKPIVTPQPTTSKSIVHPKLGNVDDRIDRILDDLYDTDSTDEEKITRLGDTLKQLLPYSIRHKGVSFDELMASVGK